VLTNNIRRIKQCPMAGVTLMKGTLYVTQSGLHFMYVYIYLCINLTGNAIIQIIYN